MWDEVGHDFVRQRLLHDRLLRQHDVYALYDFQQYTHNLVAMARRCHRTDRLWEFAELIHTAYGAMEPVSPDSSRRQWVCRGGEICEANSALLGKEVMLSSAQFLGIASSVANALSAPSTLPYLNDASFLDETIEVVTDHLLRWADEREIGKLQKAVMATPQDVSNGSSELFFTDKLLWQIAIYAELSGIVQSPHVRKGLDGTVISDDKVPRMRRHLTALLHLFSRRISFRRTASLPLAGGTLADIDRGYWRLYASNRYAGYEEDQRPLVCLPPGTAGIASAAKIFIPPNSVQPRMDIGWDFSHARRLVHTLDALVRNRSGIQATFALKESQLPGSELEKAFANELVTVVWNGDASQPLFSNYWSGANGWFGAFFDEESGKCSDGKPPYGLSESFLTGGYVSWSKHAPVLGLLGKRLFDLVMAQESETSPFITKYYAGFGGAVDAQNAILAKLMFLPSLVGGAVQD
jgi:hypothetical protein